MPSPPAEWQSGWLVSCAAWVGDLASATTASGGSRVAERDGHAWLLRKSGSTWLGSELREEVTTRATPVWVVGDPVHLFARAGVPLGIRQPRALIGALMDPVSCVSCVSWMHWVYAAETHETFQQESGMRYQLLTRVTATPRGTTRIGQSSSVSSSASGGRRGSTTRKVQPCPSPSDSTRIRPPWASTMPRHR